MCLKNCADNSQMCSRIIQCFTSWIAIQAIPFDVTQKSNILAYVFQVKKTIKRKLKIQKLNF